MSILRRIARFVLGDDALRRGRRSRREWDATWSDESPRQPWMGRGVAREVVDAVESGWIRRGARSIDIGCGEGELSAYLAEQGLIATGIDISEAAIARANRMFGQKAGVSFVVHDICASPPVGGPFDVIVDRGCLHQIAEVDRPLYRRHLLDITREGARLILFVRAFRDGVPFGDPAERDSLATTYTSALSPPFALVRSELTYLDTRHGADPETALGGLVFWFERN